MDEDETIFERCQKKIQCIHELNRNELLKSAKKAKVEFKLEKLEPIILKPYEVKKL